MSLTRKCIESRLRMFASISECKDVFDVVVKGKKNRNTGICGGHSIWSYVAHMVLSFSLKPSVSLAEVNTSPSLRMAEQRRRRALVSVRAAAQGDVILRGSEELKMHGGRTLTLV